MWSPHPPPTIPPSAAPPHSGVRKSRDPPHIPLGGGEHHEWPIKSWYRVFFPIPPPPPRHWAPPSPTSLCGDGWLAPHRIHPLSACTWAPTCCPQSLTPVPSCAAISHHIRLLWGAMVFSFYTFLPRRGRAGFLWILFLVVLLAFLFCLVFSLLCLGPPPYFFIFFFFCWSYF